MFNLVVKSSSKTCLEKSLLLRCSLKKVYLSGFSHLLTQRKIIRNSISFIFYDPIHIFLQCGVNFYLKISLNRPQVIYWVQTRSNNPYNFRFLIFTTTSGGLTCNGRREQPENLLTTKVDSSLLLPLIALKG